MKTRYVLPSLFWGLGLAACHPYKPLPLNSETVNESLTVPTSDTLRIEAQRLNHPILKPLTLDPSDGLSPDEAAVLAVLVNPSLRALRDERALADAQLLQAGLLPNPQLGYHLDRPTGGLTAGAVDGWGFDLGWDVTGLISRSARKDSAAASRSAVDLDVAWREWQTAQAARLAVVDWVALQSQRTLAREKADQLDRNLDLVRRGVDQGQMTELDLAGAETAANQAQTDWLDLDRQMEQQRLQLNRALGIPPDREMTIQKDVVLADRIDPPSLDSLLAGLEDRRLDLVALRRGYESQEASVRAAVLDQFPKINLGINHGRDTSNLFTTGVGISIDLPLFDRNQEQIAEEEATRSRLFHEYADRLFQARADIADARNALVFLNRRIEAARAGEPSLQKLVDTYRQGVAEGAADVLSYYTAWNDLTARQIEVLSLQRELEDSRVALELAAGWYDLASSPATEAAQTPQKEDSR